MRRSILSCFVFFVSVLFEGSFLGADASRRLGIILARLVIVEDAVVMMRVEGFRSGTIGRFLTNGGDV